MSWSRNCPNCISISVWMWSGRSASGCIDELSRRALGSALPLRATRGFDIAGHGQPTTTYSEIHTHLTALFPGLPRSAGTRQVKPIWILLKQETVSGSGISCAICKSAPRSRQITTPAPPTVRYDVLIFTRAKKVDGRQFNPPHG